MEQYKCATKYIRIISYWIEVIGRKNQLAEFSGEDKIGMKSRERERKWKTEKGRERQRAREKERKKVLLIGNAQKLS